MKLLMVCPYFYPDAGGVENYAYTLQRVWSVREIVLLFYVQQRNVKAMRK